MCSAAIFSGSSVIIVDLIALVRRPMLVGMMDSIFGLSSKVGPLLVGALTDRVP